MLKQFESQENREKEIHEFTRKSFILTQKGVNWAKAAFWGAVIVGSIGIIATILIANGYLILPKQAQKIQQIPSTLQKK